MNKHSTRTTTSLRALTLIASTLFVGCSDEVPVAANLDESSRTAIDAEVRAFLLKFDASLSGREETAVRDVYVDQGLTWYEDGDLRYESVEAVLAALKGFPEGMQIKTEYTDVRVKPHTLNLATVSAAFDTKVTAERSPGFGWAGAMTMLVEKNAGSWRVLNGHSSTPSPRGG